MIVASVRSPIRGKPLTYARIVPIFPKPAAAGLLQRHEESRAIRRPIRPAQPAPKDGPRINEEIRVREFQLIDHSGHNLGPVEIQIALDKAQEAGLDLVEIAPNSSPPVCKILDYGKYKYQEQKKAASARKKQKIVEVREITIRLMISEY